MKIYNFEQQQKKNWNQGVFNLIQFQTLNQHFPMLYLFTVMCGLIKSFVNEIEGFIFVFAGLSYRASGMNLYLLENKGSPVLRHTINGGIASIVRWCLHCKMDDLVVMYCDSTNDH